MARCAPAFGTMMMGQGSFNVQFPVVVIAATEFVLQLRAKKLEGYDRSSTILTMTILTCASSLMEENKVAKAADMSDAAVAAMRSFHCFH